MAFCPKCGTQLREGAAFCDVCGTPLSAGNGACNTNTNYYIYQKPKVPGKGFGIAGMVLGIIGVVYSCTLLETFSLAGGFMSAAKLSAVLGLCFYISIFAILAMVFGCTSRSRGYKNGISTSAIVLSSISFVAIALSIFTVLI